MFFMPWPWGLRVIFGCVWFLGSCFVLVCLALLFWGWVGPGLVFWTVVLTLGSGWLFVVGWGLVLLVLFGEFDPGSGRTLAACLTHASRTVKGPVFAGSG